MRYTLRFKLYTIVMIAAAALLVLAVAGATTCRSFEFAPSSKQPPSVSIARCRMLSLPARAIVLAMRSKLTSSCWL